MVADLMQVAYPVELVGQTMRLVALRVDADAPARALAGSEA